MVDTSRLRGARYGAGHGAGENISSQVMDADSAQTLHSAIAETGPLLKPVYLSSKAGIVEYYKDVYGDRTGRGGWKDHLVKDLAAQTGMKPKSLEKRFDPARLNNPEPKNKAQYEALGKKLPPSAYVPKRARGARVSFSIYFKISQSYKRVNQTVDLTDDQTARLMGEGDFDAVLEAYALNNIDQLEELEIGMMEIELLE